MRNLGFIHHARQGSILVGIVFTMFLTVLMAVTGASMYASQAFSSLNLMWVSEANAVRIGVSDYIVKVLADDSDADWSDFAGTTRNVVLGGHTANVTFPVLHAHENMITVDVETPHSSLVVTAAGSESFKVIRMPHAMQFALFHNGGGDPANPGLNLTLDDVALSNGIFYSNGDVTFGAGTNSVTSAEIYAQGSVSNPPSGTSTRINIQDPQPAFPGYDTSQATNLYESLVQDVVGGYDVLLATCDGDTTPPLCHAVRHDFTPATADFFQQGRSVSFTVTTGAGGIIDVAGSGVIMGLTDVYLQPNRGSCTANDTTMKSSDGGCKDIANSLVWSGLPTQPPYSQLDTWSGANNYCTNTATGVEGAGYNDWRLATEAELQNVAATGWPNIYFGFDPDNLFWSSDGASPTYQAVNLSSGISAPELETNTNYVVCVRTPAFSNRTLRFIPTGGDIVIIAGHSVVMTDDDMHLRVFSTESPPIGRVIIYGANGTLDLTNAPNDAAARVEFGGSWYANTTHAFNSTWVFANRGLFIGGPRVQFDDMSLLYARDDDTYVSDDTTKYLSIVGPGLPANDPDSIRIDGTLISLSSRAPNMIIQGGVFVDGLAYSDSGDLDTGTFLLGNSGSGNNNDVRIEGSVIADLFEGNEINKTEIAGEPVMFDDAGELIFPENVPDGFGSNVSRIPNTWEGP